MIRFLHVQYSTITFKIVIRFYRLRQEKSIRETKSITRSRKEEIQLRFGISEKQTIKTLIHELVHSVLHSEPV